MQKFYRFSAWGRPAFLIRQGTPSQQKHPLYFPHFFLHPFSFVTSLAFHMPAKPCSRTQVSLFRTFYHSSPTPFLPHSPLCPGKRASFPHTAPSLTLPPFSPAVCLGKKKSSRMDGRLSGDGKRMKKLLLEVSLTSLLSYKKNMGSPCHKSERFLNIGLHLFALNVK